MSTLRFVHAEHFRLGTPLNGLADSPGWLQRLATDSVRQAVRNVVETAVTRKAHFLLIAGRITDTEEDQDAVVRWLDEQFESLRVKGIPVVVTADGSHRTPGLERIADVVLQTNQVLAVELSADQQVRLTAVSSGYSGDAELIVAVGESRSHTQHRLTYHARPAIRPEENRSRHSGDGHLSLSAGAVQAVSPAEQWEAGCVLVEADTKAREIQTTLVPTDVIRFATERVTLAGTVTPDDLILEIVRASQVFDEQQPRTLAVDLVLRADVAAESGQIEQLSEPALLAELRDRLHRGHKGVWPRSVSFSSDSSLLLAADQGAAVDEYFEVINGPVSTSEVHGVPGLSVVLQGGDGISPPLVAGLVLLQRVA
ncbi:MAG: hypothetical protein RIK87_17755 [Fuerstiella sp.]